MAAFADWLRIGAAVAGMLALGIERRPTHMNTHDKIKNCHALISVFGCWPSFNDAEVVWLHLDRRATDLGDGPTIEALVRIADEKLATGSVLVHLRFAKVVELQLSGFDAPNDLYGLGIKETADRQVEVRFYSTWGVGASFGCQNVEVVGVQPGDHGDTPLGER